MFHELVSDAKVMRIYRLVFILLFPSKKQKKLIYIIDPMIYETCVFLLVPTVDSNERK